MNCNRAERLFSDCWDDELSVVERDALQAHVDACSRCRAEYDAFARTMQTVTSLPRLAAPDDFTDQVWARARSAEAERRPARLASRTWTWSLEWRWQPALAAAAALAVVAGGVWVGVLQRSSLPDSPAAPQVASRERDRDLAATPSVAEPVSPPPVVSEDARRADESSTASVEPSLRDASPADPAVAGPMAKMTAPGTDVSSRPAEAAGLASGETGAFPDSLLDHAYDVEFAFEPVNLRPVAGGAKVAPARPTPTSEVGRRASITF